MIKSRTYNGQAGLNYIQNPDLAFAKIYAVKREGIQYDKYVSGSTNRTYIHNASDGKINFVTAFAPGGEKVFVIYKPVSGTEPETPPGVCVPVAVLPSIMSDAVANEPYSHSFLLTGTRPFSLNVIQKPAWSTVTLSLFGRVTIMGTPDIAGPETLDFTVSNCGGSEPVTRNFSTLANSNNIFISSNSFSRITDVTGITYIIMGGAFPVSLVSSVSGIHNDYTGQIFVTVSHIIFPGTLILKKNGVELESKAVPSNGTYDFASQSYLSTDNIQITLN